MESQEALTKRRKSERTNAGMGSYVVAVQNDIHIRWVKLAKAAKNSIEVTELKKGANYEVDAVLKDRKGKIIGTGHYDGTNNQHAEIGAFEACINPTPGMSLSVNPPPCKRCAVVVRLYMKKYNMTLKAPETGFASTYSGGYHITKKIEDLIIQDLIDKGVLSQEQGQHYRNDIISDFQSGGWINSAKIN